MRNPNGYGTIRKLSGKRRRRPYGVYITTEFKEAKKAKDISFLQDILTEDLYKQVEKEYEAYKAKLPSEARQVQSCIGYYATKQEAMIALAEYNKNPFDVDKRKITFEQVYNAIYERDIKGMKQSAKNAYTVSYAKCESLHQMRIADIKLAHLQKVIDAYSDKSKSTQNTIIVLLHAIYKFAMENDIVVKDYSKFLRITSKAEKKTKSPFSKDEIQVLWDNLDWVQTISRKNVLTDMPMVDSLLFMIYTGVRVSEMLDIKKEDVHLDERWIDLKGTKTAAARRIIPIHKKLMPLIEKRLTSAEGEYLFGANTGKQLEYYQYKSMFFLLFLDEFKMDHTIHECRHTFATIAAASGLNPILLKKIIGHSSADITENVYTHAYIDDLVAEIDKFNL